MNWVRVFGLFVELKYISYSFVKLISVVMVLLMVNYFSYIYVSVGLRMNYGNLLVCSFFLVLFGLLLWVFGNFVGLFAHWLPEGVVGVLKIFIPVLELVGIVIRPLTLAVRLATNISCGHVIILMFRYFSFSLGWGVVFVVSVVLFVLCFIEFLVCAIQAYVFWRLLYIYYSEIDI